ncbi:amidohydrolase family protein [Magnetovibrio sp.]|uniref:amidohydrolase family protein n=1 Tax=Magnetovibrio sp. TaxID=2024836 RepID=UPI002F9326BA
MIKPVSQYSLSVVATLLVVVFSFATAKAEGMPDLYFVDAHSQMPAGLDSDTIIPLMDQAGVWRTILSARNDREPQDVADLATTHPDRITAAVRSKGKAFNKGTPIFEKFIKQQVKQPVYSAMGETILFHAQKGKKAPKIDVAIDSPEAQFLLDIAVKKGWPFIAHYEFAAAGWDKSGYMDAFEATAKAHPDHPFVLIHMGQLPPDDVSRLIAAHGNVYFMMSHSNPITLAENSSQPWVNLFEGENLAPQWASVMSAHPDRFILAFDNVWPEFWGKFYLDQAALWRKALTELKPDVAHALAHGNAERLWNLPPR